MSAHPYGKDNLPARRGRRWRVSVQYRILRQTSRVRFSSLTGWEAPDPAWWAAQGYAVVNCDLRGAGTSGGTASLLSDQEAGDVRDLIEWAAVQPWSTGAVGMLGVSYLAISQWKAAALRPPHLKAICPWEGFTDAYRDLAFPGGVREQGFIRLWSLGLRKVRQSYRFTGQQRAHPLRDDWWQALAPDLRAYYRARAGLRQLLRQQPAQPRVVPWAGSRSPVPRSSCTPTAAASGPPSTRPQARDVQRAFFDRYLRGADVPAPPRVRLEVRESRDVIAGVRAEDDWPLRRTQWTPLYLTGAGLAAGPASADGQITFDARSRGACFDWEVPADTEVTGPMALRLLVEVHGSGDVNLFAGVEKWDGGRYVGFEGSYGFGRDRVTSGWLKASLRELDERASRPHEPVQRHPPQAARARAGHPRWISRWGRPPPCSARVNGCGW